MSIAENLLRAEDAVSTACRKAGRPREEVRLMAVSKTHPVELLLEAAAAGQRLFGENRVQEFSGKTEALLAAGRTVDLGRGTAAVSAEPVTPEPVSKLSAQASPDSVHVHLIGHLQSNKAARAAEVFSAVDTLDSLRLAERLHAAAQSTGRSLPVLLEIKLSHEETKEGLPPDTPELAALLERLPDFAPHLPLRGLMTIAPFGDTEAARDCFRQLRTLRDRLAQQHPRLCFDELSMGMSGDFEAAIEEGSTTVRIGTAIFGARPKTK